MCGDTACTHSGGRLTQFFHPAVSGGLFRLFGNGSDPDPVGDSIRCQDEVHNQGTIVFQRLGKSHTVEQAEDVLSLIDLWIMSGNGNQFDVDLIRFYVRFLVSNIYHNWL